MVQRRKMWKKWSNFQEHISCELLRWFSSNLVCRVTYMESIKYVNMIEINWVVIEIQVIENSEFVVLVNSILVRHTAFLATDTWPCGLINNHLMPTYVFAKHGDRNKQYSNDGLSLLLVVFICISQIKSNITYVVLKLVMKLRLNLVQMTLNFVILNKNREHMYILS